MAIAIVVISVALVRSRIATRAEAASAPPALGATTVRSLEPVLTPSTLPGDVSVVVVRDPSSVSYYEGAARLDSVVAWWESTVSSLGARVRIAAPDDQTLRDADVLVVPSQPCLGDRARRAIEDALARGHGVIATWLTGTRNEACTTVGWSLPARLSGAMRLDTLDTREAVYVTVTGDAAIGAGVPPGSRIELLVANHVAARVPGRAVLYTDRAMNPAPAGGARLVDAAIAQRETAGARSVYFGFEPMHAAASPWNRALARLLVRNAVHWAAGRSSASIEAWPRGYRGAAMIAQDVEDEFANAANAVDSLDAVGVRGTWYLVSDLARGNRPLVRRLSRNGEIGTHTENHLVLAGASEAEQAHRLATTQRDLVDIVGAPVAGLRPPEEQFDVATMRAWVQTGGTYVFGANDARTASPEILAVGADTIVLLARITNDDVISVRRAGRVDVGSLVSEYANALEKVHALGGLYIMSYHSQFMSRPELVPVVAAVARRAKADSSLWKTTGREVARWWLIRHRLAVTTRDEIEGALRIDIANRGADDADSVVVRALLPPLRRLRGVDGARVLPAASGEARLLVARIAAGATRSVTLSLEAQP